MHGLVYLITNKVTGQVYVGQTTQSLKERWGDHVTRAATSERTSSLYEAIRNYGEHCFEISILDRANSQEELWELEKAWILRLCSSRPLFGYNMQLGGREGFPTEETRAKISAGKMGQIVSPATREKMSIARKGKSLPPAVGAKMSIARMGHYVSAETRAKISAANLGRPLSAEHRAKLSLALITENPSQTALYQRAYKARKRQKEAA